MVLLFCKVLEYDMKNVTLPAAPTEAKGPMQNCEFCESVITVLSSSLLTTSLLNWIIIAVATCICLRKQVSPRERGYHILKCDPGSCIPLLCLQCPVVSSVVQLTYCILSVYTNILPFARKLCTVIFSLLVVKQYRDSCIFVSAGYEVPRKDNHQFKI